MSTSSTSRKSSPPQFLRGTSYFLHLKGYSHKTSLERRLVRHGGKVEKGLSKSVSYLVINTKEPYSNKREHSRRKHYGSDADLVHKAKRLGVKIVLLDELFIKLQKLNLLPQKKEKYYRITRLKSPFLRIEDNSGLYQPLVHEMEVWPVPRKNCHPNSCPFDTPRSYRTSKTFSKSRRTRRGRHSDRSVKKSPGFCDCCEHSYNDWTRHIRTHDHRRQVEVKLAAIDAMIDRTGYSLKIFLQRRKRKLNTS